MRDVRRMVAAGHNSKGYAVKALAIILIMVMLLAMMTGCSSSGSTGENGKIYVLCYGDYFDPDLEYEFEAATGYDLVIDYFDTNEELYPIIKNNTVQYDVICASDYMINKLISEGLLTEINFENIPNIQYLSDDVKQFIDEYDPGMLYSVPHCWGTYGILYNTTMVDEEDIGSWSILWNEKYAGQIVMPDSIREAYLIAGKMLGYSVNTTDESEIKAMTELLKEQKSLVYSYANDSAREPMIGGSAAMAVITSGEVLYSQELNEDLAFFVPEEGTEIWTDCWAIPAVAENKEGAEAWINFMMDGEVAATNFDYLTYAIPNTQIADLMTDEVLNPSAEILEKGETLQNLGSEADDLYSQYWKEVKSY